MIQILSLLFTLAALAQPDTMIFKFPNRIHNTPIQPSYQISASGAGAATVVNVIADLRADSYDNTWLWETYEFSKAESSQIISPALPPGCAMTYFMSGAPQGGSYFRMVFAFQGRSCLKLEELLTKTKLKMMFTGVPVVDENKKKDRLYFLIDDFNHASGSNEVMATRYANFVNGTDHKQLATYVAFNNFPTPKTFDSCAQISVQDLQGRIFSFAFKSFGLYARPDRLALIQAMGEFGDRIPAMIDPEATGFVKACQLSKQFITPSPRNMGGAVTSELYFSLSSSFKMLFQTNAPN